MLKATTLSPTNIKNALLKRVRLPTQIVTLENRQMDTLTPEERSARMSLVQGKNTKPEMLVRSALHRVGLRFRLHSNKVYGRPDIVFTSSKVAIFVHGCFWHRHEGCSRTRMPKSNTSFWEAKFARTIERDIEVRDRLEIAGWHSHIIWECELPRMLHNHVAEICFLVRSRQEN